MLLIPDNLTYAANRDGALIHDKPKNAMTPLNSTGAYIWQRLDRGISLEEIITELAHETHADREVVAADTERFLKDLKSRGLLLGA